MPDKPMSKAAMKRHIQSGGTGDCPYCKAENDGLNIEYSELDPVEDGDIQQKATCTKCGRKWMDVFRLVEVHELFS